ncbi:50S ribosomal protein L24 [Candidatus Calescamantes bacterium]|nr:50S ribosomal protein L24 [Candidatus Calescamantes bacterium]
MPKFSIRSGDEVIVIRGKDKGKRGKVRRVFPREEKVIVEGVNIAKKAVRPSRRYPQGGIVEIEMPLHISKVMLYCPRCERGVRVGRKFLEDGTKVRYCKKCGEILEKT